MDGQVGYTLVDSDGGELAVYGDTYGVCAAVPAEIKLPNGATVACPAVDAPLDESGCRLVRRYRSPTANDYAVAIQANVDAAARSRGYADGVALASYAASTIESWKAEALAFVAWRDSVWIYAYGRLSDAQEGIVMDPSEVVAAMPPIAWPK